MKTYVKVIDPFVGQVVWIKSFVVLSGETYQQPVWVKAEIFHLLEDRVEVILLQSDQTLIYVKYDQIFTAHYS